jgi:hypothetical protein
MNDSGHNRVSALDARDNRRWLIGVGISVAFGLFGVVMALLSYSRHTPAAAGAPAAHGPAASTTHRAPPESDARPRRQRRHEKQ